MQVQKAMAVLELVGQVGAADVQQLGQERAGDSSAAAQKSSQEAV
ncbi:hypothetical protein [Streptomyces sp. NPDC002845]